MTMKSTVGEHCSWPWCWCVCVCVCGGSVLNWITMLACLCSWYLLSLSWPAVLAQKWNPHLQTTHTCRHIHTNKHTCMPSKCSPPPHWILCLCTELNFWSVKFHGHASRTTIKGTTGLTDHWVVYTVQMQLAQYSQDIYYFSSLDFNMRLFVIALATDRPLWVEHFWAVHVYPV